MRAASSRTFPASFRVGMTSDIVGTGGFPHPACGLTVAGPTEPAPDTMDLVIVIPVAVLVSASP